MCREWMIWTDFQNKLCKASFQSNKLPHNRRKHEDPRILWGRDDKNNECQKSKCGIMEWPNDVEIKHRTTVTRRSKPIYHYYFSTTPFNFWAFWTWIAKNPSDLTALCVSQVHQKENRLNPPLAQVKRQHKQTDWTEIVQSRLRESDLLAGANKSRPAQRDDDSHPTRLSWRFYVVRAAK